MIQRPSDDNSFGNFVQKYLPKLSQIPDQVICDYKEFKARLKSVNKMFHSHFFLRFFLWTLSESA